MELEEKLEDVRSEKEMLKQEKKRVAQDYERCQMEKAQEKGRHVRMWLRTCLCLAYSCCNISITSLFDF